MRSVLHLTTARPELELGGMKVAGPTRFVIIGPRTGGACLAELRRLLAPLGRVRFSGTPWRIQADLDPGEPEAPTVALGMIARSDADGLERAILSALPFVDEVVIGVDDRSDPETHQVAQAYADSVHSFGFAELGLTAEEWANNGMHFAAARNIGRKVIRSPWTLVIDSDEFIRLGASDFRQKLRQAGEHVGAFDVVVHERRDRHRNFQRLARTEFRWWSPVHNQLGVSGQVSEAVAELEIEHCTRLRRASEIARRDRQRNEQIAKLEQDAAAGEINALYHLAVHKIGQGLDEGVKLAEDYRLRLEVGGPGQDQRAHLAMCAAVMYYNRDDLDRADLWATRVFLDGARPEAMCLKGDICEDRGDLAGALAWFEAAAVLPDRGQFQWIHVTVHKLGRRAGLRRALGVAAA